MVSFDVTSEDSELIAKIVERAAVEGQTALAMDLTAVHANGCTLNLKALLTADDFNFNHDVFGIIRHIDRNTGKLRGHFLPRFAN